MRTTRVMTHDQFSWFKTVIITSSAVTTVFGKCGLTHCVDGRARWRDVNKEMYWKSFTSDSWFFEHRIVDKIPARCHLFLQGFFWIEMIQLFLPDTSSEELFPPTASLSVSWLCLETIILWQMLTISVTCHFFNGILDKFTSKMNLTLSQRLPVLNLNG